MRGDLTNKHQVDNDNMKDIKTKNIVNPPISHHENIFV